MFVYVRIERRRVCVLVRVFAIRNDGTEQFWMRVAGQGGLCTNFDKMLDKTFRAHEQTKHVNVGIKRCVRVSAR